ncbi:hypothetical protein RHOW815_001167 [Candidatus Rhabdochlamydia sp. W815]|nr:hypothetical protein RHOW815_001167 [Candidatus Rhabdochlamydia sp. W815]
MTRSYPSDISRKQFSKIHLIEALVFLDPLNKV